MVASANNKNYQILDEVIELNLDKAPTKQNEPIKISLNSLSIDGETYSADVERSDNLETAIVLPKGQELSFTGTSLSGNSNNDTFTIQLLDQVTLGSEESKSVTFTPGDVQAWSELDADQFAAESSLDIYDITLKVSETNQYIPDLKAGTVLDFLHYTETSQALDASLDPYCKDFETIRFSLLSTDQLKLESNTLVQASVIDVSNGEGLSASNDLTVAKSYFGMPDETRSITVQDDKDKADIVIGKIMKNGQVSPEDSGGTENTTPIKLEEGGNDYVGHLRLNSQPIANVTVYLETDNAEEVNLSNDLLKFKNISIQTDSKSNNTLIKSKKKHSISNNAYQKHI